MIARRTPRRSRLRRALLPLILGFSLSAASNSADAFTCGEEFYENGGPLDANEIEVPLDAQPWFFVNCGIADTLNCELRDNSDPSLLLANELSINGCELAEPIVSDSGTTYPQGVAHLAPTELLTAGHAYNVSCGGNNGPSGTFVVRNNNTPSMAPLTLDNVVPRREIEEGCCGQRHLSIKRDYSGGTLSEFLAEGGIVEIQYADGHFITDDDTERDEFPDTEDDITITVIAANGTRGEAVTINIDDFERDLAYIPCSVGSGSRGAIILWLLLPFVWLRRTSARRGTSS